jgi:hypothetical protein
MFGESVYDGERLRPRFEPAPKAPMKRDTGPRRLLRPFLNLLGRVGSVS